MDQEYGERLHQHDISLNSIREWAERAENRITALENQRDIMNEIKIALSEIRMSNTHFSEKLGELKASIEAISKDNKEQHEALGKRVKDIEDKPARSWDKFIWLIIAGFVGGVIGYLLKALFN